MIENKIQLTSLIKFKVSKHILRFNVIFYVIYNIYFGWNVKAISDAEKTCDALFIIILLSASFLYLNPVFKYLENQACSFEYSYKKALEKEKSANED